MPLPLFQEKRDIPPPPHSKIKYVIAVAAGKGGVGKSTVAINLALAMEDLGYSVGLLDADIYGPSIRKMLSETTPPRQKGERIEPARCGTIRMISMAFFRKEEEAAAVRAPIANRLINQFISDVDWGELDFLIIDFPPGTGDIHLTLAQQANLSGAVLVTTPQQVALLDVRKALHLFDQVRVPILAVVENMSYYRDPFTGDRRALFGEGGGQQLALEAKAALASVIPIDPLLSYCGDNGESIFTHSEAGHLAALFIDLAEKLVHQVTHSKKEMAAKEFTVDQLQAKHEGFTIVWSDGMKKDYLYKAIQQQCPCAKCQIGGMKETGDLTLTAVSIEKVGSYGMRIRFNSGCSAGIYSYEMLYNMK